MKKTRERYKRHEIKLKTKRFLFLNQKKMLIFELIISVGVKILFITLFLESKIL